jgi:hypothetical protein
MDCIHRRFCKKVWKISRFSAIGAAGLKIGGDSRKGKICLAMKPDPVFCT